MVYLIVNGVLCFGYVLFWIICWEKNNLLKALSLSVLPSMIFLFSGIMLGGIPLLAFSVIFAIFHIFISVKNAKRK